MASEAVSRRINTISGHFTAGVVTEDVTVPNTHLFPVNCSSNLSTPFRRLDGRMHFGRQASAAQGYFMRQAVTSTEQGNLYKRPGVCSPNCINEEKSTAREPPLFSRPRTVEPLFSRPAADEYNCSSVSMIESFAQDKKLPASECLKFARQGEKQVTSRRQMFSSQINEWSPRINIAESKSNHVITVELPGVDIKDIRVEMDDKNLTVKGKRSMKWWKARGCSNDSFATFHKREIMQGPYQVVWPLPPSANKDCVSAEFVDGILHITIPKL